MGRNSDDDRAIDLHDRKSESRFDRSRGNMRTLKLHAIAVKIADHAVGAMARPPRDERADEARALVGLWSNCRHRRGGNLQFDGPPLELRRGESSIRLLPNSWGFFVDKARRALEIQANDTPLVDCAFHAHVELGASDLCRLPS
jgi:hypothetical protein